VCALFISGYSIQDAAIPKTQPVVIVLAQGMTGDAVTMLQERLTELGYYQGTIDGYFGPVTREAVLRYQQDHNMIADGVAWDTTLASLGVYIPRTLEAAYEVHYVGWGSSGNVVRIVQERLQALGYYTGAVDGVFGQQTYNAVARFQESQGLVVDGIAGNRTLEQLGISSLAAENLETYEYSLFDDELALLAAVIHGEARGEPYEGQVAVGAVVLNRVRDAEFPDTLSEIILQSGAFTAVSDQQIFIVPNKTAVQAAKEALRGWDPVDGALYYWNPQTATSRWIWSVPVTGTIGRHVFGAFETNSASSSRAGSAEGQREEIEETTESDAGE